jgi:hypothetical protein
MDLEINEFKILLVILFLSSIFIVVEMALDWEYNVSGGLN